MHALCHHGKDFIARLRFLQTCSREQTANTYGLRGERHFVDNESCDRQSLEDGFSKVQMWQ